PLNTSVSLQGTDLPVHATELAFLFITQRFCDTPNDTVFRTIAANEVPLKQGDFKALPNFKSASLRATVPVSVFDQHVSGCTGGTPVIAPAAPKSITINTDWTATGPPQQSSQFGLTRVATATGALSGLGNLGA